jgi:hypothetical protein
MTSVAIPDAPKRSTIFTPQRDTTTICTARSRSSGGYLLDETPDIESAVMATTFAMGRR